MSTPRPWQHASCWALALALVGGCSARTPHLVHIQAEFYPTPSVETCAAAEQLGNVEHAWTLHSEYGAHSFALHPVDELWFVSVSDTSETSFDDRHGFAAWIECGRQTFALEVLECDTMQSRALFIPADQLPQAGTPARPCQLRVELRHGEDRWVGYEDGVVLRRGLRQWYEDAR